jgi:hypothetical protein
MGSLARRFARLLGPALMFWACAAVPARASEIAASASPNGLRIIGPETVLREYCRQESDGTLWLTLPGGQTFELVTSTGDAAIANPGDGSFHAYDEDQVRAAIAATRFPLQGVSADIYLLPFPRRGALDSGAGPGLILLSPGVAPMSASRQHAEVVHELGHVVQYQWMPDGDARWTEYRRLRGIDNAATYNSTTLHANRPHEIFAEDFRALFGGVLANYSGSIENATLAEPAGIAGLESFMIALPGGATAVGRLMPSANPARGAVEFARPGSSAAAVDLFDVGGRRLATLTPTALGARTLWRWDGRDGDGRPVPAGMVLARVRGERGAVARVSWLAR